MLLCYRAQTLFEQEKMVGVRLNRESLGSAILGPRKVVSSHHIALQLNVVSRASFALQE